MDNLTLAQKLIEQEFWKEKTFELTDLFRIRDCIKILNQYGLGDLDLLREVELYIKQKEKQCLIAF